MKPRKLSKQRYSANSRIALGVTWYNRSQWERMREVACDSEQFGSTYEEWLANAKKGIKHLAEQGIQPERVMVNVDELIAWCRSQGCRIDGATRTKFVNFKLEEKYWRKESPDSSQVPRLVFYASRGSHAHQEGVIMNTPRNVYTVKVALAHTKRTYREIEILGSQTLDDLHRIIFKAFDRFDEHLYSFFMTRKKLTGMTRIYDYPEYVHPQGLQKSEWGFRRREQYSAKMAKLDNLKLDTGTVFYYLFDFGDEWWHELTIKKIEKEDVKKKYPRIAKVQGESPPQYPEMEEE